MKNRRASGSPLGSGRMLGCMLLAAVFMILNVTGTSWAREARPWLCRIKPVFSGSHPMVYTADGSSGARPSSS